MINHKFAVVDELMNTRDFLGNERKCFIQYQIDNKMCFSNQDAVDIKNDFEFQWSEAQKDAGVTRPLTQDERAKAYKDLEPA